MKLIGIFFYLLVLLFIGWAASRKMKDLRDYYAGGKRFGFWAAAFSSRATGESAWLLIGLTGMGAALGAQAVRIVVGEVLGLACWTKREWRNRLAVSTRIDWESPARILTPEQGMPCPA